MENEGNPAIIRKSLMREDCKWKDIGDVDWDDLDYFIAKAKRVKDLETFNTSIRILEGLKQQILERK